MFKLTKEEKQQLVQEQQQYAPLKFSPALPNVFTEHGAVMLASVLNSERAIAVNIQIVRIFTKMREILSSHKDILLKLEQAERKITAHDEDIRLIFEYIKQLLNEPQVRTVIEGFIKKI